MGELIYSMRQKNIVRSLVKQNGIVLNDFGNLFFEAYCSRSELGVQKY